MQVSDEVDERALAAVRELVGEAAQAAQLLRVVGLDPGDTGVGDGDRALLAAHRAVTGHDLELALACPACGALAEVALTVATVPEVAPRCACTDTGGGVREPSYGDLLGLPADPTEAAAELLRRCTVGAPERAPDVDDLDRVDDSLSGPLRLTCPSCGAASEHPVDVVPLVLRAVIATADGFDREVHLLARTYSWDLAVIEALPRQRRRRLAALIAEGA